MAKKPPTYRRNPDGRSFVQFNRKRYYLGRFGTSESLRRYHEFLARIECGAPPEPPTGGAAVSVGQICQAYLSHAQRYYVIDGKQTSEVSNVKYAIDPVSALFFNMKPVDFGPKALKAVQQYLIDAEYSRTWINAQVHRIKRMFKWAASEEMIPVEIYTALATVRSLAAGRTTAKETEKIKPVAWEVVKETLPHMSRQTKGMVLTQYYCGLRPCEVVMMRVGEIDMEGEIWLYRRDRHKTRHHGIEYVKAIPKVAQAVIAEFLKDDPTAFLFSPKEWREERHAAAKKKRKLRRCKVKDHYTTATYNRSIHAAVARLNKARKKIDSEAAQMDKWNSNQLRHAIATKLRQEISQEAAQAWLGHASIDMTNVYTERQVSELKRIAHEVDSRLAAVPAAEPSVDIQRSDANAS